MGKGKRIARKQRREHKRSLGKGGCFIYVVTDAAGEIRYCGQTRCRPEDKVDWLVRGARKNPHTPFNAWLLEQERTECAWRLKVVDENGRWDVSEILWIDRLRQAGHPLLNVLRGGRDSIQCPVSGLNPRKKTNLQKALPAAFAQDDLMQREHMASIMFEGG